MSRCFSVEQVVEAVQLMGWRRCSMATVTAAMWLFFVQAYVSGAQTGGTMLHALEHISGCSFQQHLMIFGFHSLRSGVVVRLLRPCDDAIRSLTDSMDCPTETQPLNLNSTHTGVNVPSTFASTPAVRIRCSASVSYQESWAQSLMHSCAASKSH